MKTQSERVLDYLKRNRVATSNELRDTLKIVDVPKAVSILTHRGIDISASRNKDGTSTYTLGEEKKTRRVVFDGDTARIEYV